MGIVRVNSGGFSSNTAGTAFPFTLGWTPTNGNTLIAITDIISATNQAVASIAETGATWSAAGAGSFDNAAAEGAGPVQRNELYHAVNISGVSTSITFNFSATVTAIVVYVIEYSGIKNPGFLDQLTSNACTSACGTSLTTGTTGTTATAVEVWLAGVGQRGTSTFSAPTNGFSLVQTITDAGANISAAWLEKIVAATGTASTGVTSSVNNAWCATITTYQAPGALVNSLMLTGIGN